MLHRATTWSTFLAICILTVAQENIQILSRKKRYLVFPEGSTLTYTMSGSSNLPVPILSAWSVVTECDVGYKLPFSPRKPSRPKKKNNQRRQQQIIPSYYYQHRRDRREVYEQLETLLGMQGLNGTACVRRAICEAATRLPSEQTSFIHDMMRLIFTIPPGSDDNPDPEVSQYESAASSSDCDIWVDQCSFSLLDFHLSDLWD